MKNVEGSIVALVTPFLENGDIDYDSLFRLLDFHLENETNAILVNGTTSESPTISLNEFDRLTKEVVQYVRGRLPVIAGTGSNNTEDAIIKSQVAEYNGVNGLLVVSPYYNKPTQSGLRQYFTEIAKSTELPIIIYNVPGRTGSDIGEDLLIELAETIPNVTGIKEASGSMERIMNLIQRAPADFSVYSGDDSLALSTVLVGGQGCISVVANQVPKVFSQMLRYAKQGEIELAKNLHYKYYNLMKLNFIETNPIPVKTSLHHMGLIGLNFRSPMCAMEKETSRTLKSELDLLNLKVAKEVKEVILE